MGDNLSAFVLYMTANPAGVRIQQKKWFIRVTVCRNYTTRAEVDENLLASAMRDNVFIVFQ